MMVFILAVIALALCISGAFCTGSGDLKTTVAGFGLIAVAAVMAVGI